MIPLSPEGAEWTDQLIITLRETDRFTETDDDQIVIKVTDGEAWPRTWLKDQLRDLGVDPVHHEPQFMLRERGDETSWGGDASIAELLLSVSNAAWQGIVGNGAAHLFDKMVDKLKGSGKLTPRSITEQEAEGHARWVVEVRYHVAAANLLLRSVEVVSGGSATVVLADSMNGTTYEVEVRDEGGVTSMCRIKRTLA